MLQGEHHNHRPLMVAYDDGSLRVADLGIEAGCYFNERLERVISRVANEDGVIGPRWRPRGLDIAQVYQKAEAV
jgi:hypothetical protein